MLSFFVLSVLNVPLFLAGYNHLEVAEFLLEKGADVNAQDKGGLIPLHNASSYGVRTFYFSDCECKSHSLNSIVSFHSSEFSVCLIYCTLSMVSN